MKRSLIVLCCIAVAAALVPATAGAVEDPPPFDYATPLFGLNAEADGGLLVSDAGQGIVGLSQTEAELVAPLPGVSDAIPSGDGDIIAVTGEPPEAEGPPPEGAQTLYRVGTDGAEEIADLFAFEQDQDPDATLFPDKAPESNPFDLARLEGATVVADAAGNSLLRVTDAGDVQWMALFQPQAASTAHLREMVDCENPPPDMAFVCELPPEIPAEAVPTAVAVGPDGALYVGELTGFPGTPGIARLWRVDPDANNVVCPGEGCTEVFVGHEFSAIIDVAFGPDGTLYVVELDEGGFIAAELGAGQGGTVNACDVESESCAELTTGTFLSTALAVGDLGTIYTTVGALVPGQAGVQAIGTEFADDDASVHELNIAVIGAAGITQGCNPPDNTQFCPDAATTRGQMAAFLARALDLPESAVDAFEDDAGSVFEADINALAAAGITRGCNPPDNDEYCPGDEVTRAQMAAFLVRALDLPESAVDAFEDDAGSVFEADINALAAAGITRGCNPPDNDEYCPGDEVTRAQMAAFLVRALDLPASSEDHFEDDAGSVFEADINALAAAGITMGCNPPDNDEYCPDGFVTRAQMATFLVRALDLP